MAKATPPPTTDIPEQTTTWTTRDLLTIRICDMADSHLINTFNLMLRNINNVARALDAGPVDTHSKLLTIGRVYGDQGKAVVLELLRRGRIDVVDERFRQLAEKLFNPS